MAVHAFSREGSLEEGASRLMREVGRHLLLSLRREGLALRIVGGGIANALGWTASFGRVARRISS